MQAAFRRAIDEGSALFKSEADWLAFATGFTAENLKSMKMTKDAVDESTQHSDIEKTGDGAAAEIDSAARCEAFKASVLDSWVWMDYISVPQTVGLSDAAAVQETIGKQADAIRSIPSYIRRATQFWICTPDGARHENGQLCSYGTWNERGWCRLEETTIALLHMQQHARPLHTIRRTKQIDLLTVRICSYGAHGPYMSLGKASYGYLAKA